MAAQSKYRDVQGVSPIGARPLSDRMDENPCQSKHALPTKVR